MDLTVTPTFGSSQHVGEQSPTPQLVKVIKGPRYPWQATVDGADLVVTGQLATWFGGSDDPQDDGQTASGISTKSNPSFLGCALPLDYKLPPLPAVPPKSNPCAGAPFPKFPWFTNVIVTNLDSNLTVPVKLIDIGPSAPPKAVAAIDLTQAAFVKLGGNLKKGSIRVTYRVIGGAKFMGLA